MSSESFNYGANRTVAGREMDVDDFIGHRSREGSAGVLLRSKEWKKKGKLDLWLHCGAKISSVWRHSFWRVVEREDKDTRKKERIVVFSPWNCHEDEAILKRQYKRSANGTRVFPPERCPFDKLAEEIHAMALRREILWTDPVLRFEGDDRSKTILLRAGDFWGAFGSKFLSEEEIGQVRRTGSPAKRDAWQTNLVAKCSYVFVALIADDLDSGARILIEGEAIGRGMQDAIQGEQERYDPKRGNPRLHPYAFRWTYDDSKNFDEKYRVRVIDGQPSDEVLAVIRDAEPPDTSGEIAFGDVDELRALLEAHALVKLPLDACFPPRDPAGAQPKGEPPPSLDGDDRYDCDHCGAKECMSVDDIVCPKCGAQYGQVVQGDSFATVLFTRPCGNCKEQVPLPGVGGAAGKFGDVATCAGCGEQWREEEGKDGEGRPNTVWAHVEKKPEPAKEEPKPAGRRARR